MKGTVFLSATTLRVRTGTGPALHFHHFEIRWCSSHPRDRLRHVPNTQDAPAFVNVVGEPDRIRNIDPPQNQNQNQEPAAVLLPRTYDRPTGAVKMNFTLGLPQGYFAAGRTDARFEVVARAVFLPRGAVLTQEGGMAVVSKPCYITMSHLYSDWDLPPRRASHYQS